MPLWESSGAKTWDNVALKDNSRGRRTDWIHRREGFQLSQFREPGDLGHAVHSPLRSRQAIHPALSLRTHYMQEAFQVLEMQKTKPLVGEML